ncbi:MAG TPA: hypothetical protein VF316_06310 [Polyangiaceae bacterium]
MRSAWLGTPVPASAPEQNTGFSNGGLDDKAAPLRVGAATH